MNSLNEIKTSTTHYWLDQDRDILYGKIMEGAEIKLEDAEQGCLARKEIIPEGVRLPLILDIRGIESISSEARRLSSKSTYGLSAIALIVGTGFAKIIGNYALFLNRPKIPTKLFKNTTAAQEWVSRFNTVPKSS